MAPRKLTLEDYLITKEGYVINKTNGHQLLGQPNNKGYLRVTIGKKQYFIHRLVAEKYIPNPDNKPQVNHKDGNKLNNRAENLEWVTNSENKQHAQKTGLIPNGEACSWSILTKEQVIEIREAKDKTNVELAKIYGVSPSTISDIKYYRTWKDEKIC